MRVFLPTIILLFSILAAPAVQAKTPFKQLFKALDAPQKITGSSRFYSIRAAVSRQVLQSYSRRASHRFVSLENVSIYPKPIVAFPPFPLPEKETELYRGMTLNADGQQLRHIFKHGLEIAQTRAINFNAYNGSQYPANQKAVYATPNLRLALIFALDDTRFDQHIPVIIHLKRISNKRIVSIPHDIPPSWICRVSVLLEKDGQLVWGEIKLDKNDHFIFTPYPIPKTEK